MILYWVFALSESVYSRAPKGFCLSSLKCQKCQISMSLKLPLTIYFSQSWANGSVKSVLSYWWWQGKAQDVQIFVLFAVVCRLSSIRSVLRHADRQVRPPEEGTGCLWWLHPVLYCTTGNTLNQNELYVIGFIQFLPTCVHIHEYRMSFGFSTRITTRLLLYS